MYGGIDKAYHQSQNTQMIHSSSPKLTFGESRIDPEKNDSAMLVREPETDYGTTLDIEEHSGPGRAFHVVIVCLRRAEGSVILTSDVNVRGTSHNEKLGGNCDHVAQDGPERRLRKVALLVRGRRRVVQWVESVSPHVACQRVLWDRKRHFFTFFGGFFVDKLSILIALSDVQDRVKDILGLLEIISRHVAAASRRDPSDSDVIILPDVRLMRDEDDEESSPTRN
jgi:hypothetical protein